MMRNFNWKRGLTAGGILGSVIILLLCQIIYEESQKPKINRDIHVCNIPDDIPSKFASGGNVYWDCEWQACYNDGDVFVKWVDDDKTKGAKLIGRNLSY